MFKFLPGLLLLQLVTAGLFYIGINWSHNPQLIIVLIAFAVIVAVLTTFWFGSIVRDMHHSSHAKLQARHAKDREKIILKAEREKAKVTSKSYQQIEKATKNAHAKANFKVGAAFAAAIAAGGIMIMGQCEKMRNRGLVRRSSHSMTGRSFSKALRTRAPAT